MQSPLVSFSAVFTLVSQLLLASIGSATTNQDHPGDFPFLDDEQSEVLEIETRFGDRVQLTSLQDRVRFVYGPIPAEQAATLKEFEIQLVPSIGALCIGFTYLVEQWAPDGERGDSLLYLELEFGAESNLNHSPLSCEAYVLNLQTGQALGELPNVIYLKQ